MTTEQLKAAARLEGIVDPVVLVNGTTVAGFINDVETRREYLTDHNDIQRLVDGLAVPSGYYGDYMKLLYKITSRDGNLLLQATCVQKLEAILNEK